ncbi:hypothetical protein KHU50_002944 [Colletotrichum sp. SAR 10_65]|nr:hypothetical protein KHU50_002944 [Colletotrichum sp. SAR 10_65]KAJ5000818.1 hypothetical protein K4K48_002139 [Colletotrichum sp. SAR 10_66]
MSLCADCKSEHSDIPGICHTLKRMWWHHAVALPHARNACEEVAGLLVADVLHWASFPVILSWFKPSVRPACRHTGNATSCTPHLFRDPSPPKPRFWPSFETPKLAEPVDSFMPPPEAPQRPAKQSLADPTYRPPRSERARHEPDCDSDLKPHPEPEASRQAPAPSDDNILSANDGSGDAVDDNTFRSRGIPTPGL